MNHLFKRTSAYLIDCFICYSFVMVVFQWAILSQIREPLGITNEWFENSLNMELYVLISISLPVWIYFTLLDSKITKGTFGKRLLKLSVRNNDSNGKISIGKSLSRTFFKLLPWEIAHAGIIFPTPVYFAEEPQIGILTYVGIALFLTFLFSILWSKNRQSIYDLILGTRVVDKPSFAHKNESLKEVRPL